MKAIGLRIKCPVCGCYLHSKTLMKKEVYDVDVKAQFYKPDINDKFKGRMEYELVDDLEIIATVRVHLIDRLKNALKHLGVLSKDKHRDIEITKSPRIEATLRGYHDYDIPAIPIMSVRAKDRYVGAKVEVVK